MIKLIVSVIRLIIDIAVFYVLSYLIAKSIRSRFDHDVHNLHDWEIDK